MAEPFDTNDNEMELGNNILTLLDDEGVEHTFEVVSEMEVEGITYLATIPQLQNPQELLDDAGELVILKPVVEDDEEFLELIQDEEEFNLISAIFMQELSDTFDFEE
ncbi:DUF1292 domain-containing protein [Ruminococcaceae bacterium OttesenSCG-928-L11]|nr:DUF1292 domain-containing protein [Ruminococcaceae bacterium OttesenSCG-928-L11]